MGDLSKFMVKAFLRKLLTALGAALLTHGVLTDAEAGGFVDDYLEELAGGVILGASSAWTLIYQKYVREKIVTALSMPQGATPAQLEKAMAGKVEGVE